MDHGVISGESSRPLTGRLSVYQNSVSTMLFISVLMPGLVTS